jgi:hypothetical protein
VNKQNKNQFAEIDSMRGISDTENDEFYSEIFAKKKIVKKFYLSLNLNLFGTRFYAQINNITLKVPPTPALYNWDSLPKVC